MKVPARGLVRHSLSVALAATVCVGSVRALAVPASPVPDFYQHQAWNAPTDANMKNPKAPSGIDGWEGWTKAYYKMAEGGVNPGANAALNELLNSVPEGFCWYAAVVDALYPWTQYKDKGRAPFANLFGNGDITMPGKWVPASNSAMLAMKAASDRRAISINVYLDSLNFGPHKNTGGVALADTSFTVVGGTLMVKLAGRTEKAELSPIALAQMAYNDGLTDVVTIKPKSPGDSNLWWGNSFHAMAIAGLGGPNQLLVADPDSVPINADNFDGGWWNPSTVLPLVFSSNGTFYVKSGELDAANKAATASLTAAITAVNANIYTTTQAEGPTPVPGAGKYTAANLYGSITLSSTAGQQNQITAASNTSYAGKTMLTSFDVINTLAMTRKFITPAQLAVGAPGAGVNTATAAYRDTFEWTGEIAEDVEQIEIFPVVPLADSRFTFTEAGWSESPITTDPFSGVWGGGGEDLSVTSAGSDLVPGEIADTTLDTTAPADQYNIFFQLADGDWWVQAFGAANNAFGTQSAFVAPVPEPGTLPLLATGHIGVLGYRWRRRKAAM
jgi:hypothetical protein